MKFCDICVRDIDIDLIPFQCGDRFLEHEERKEEKHEIEPDKEKPKVLNFLKSTVFVHPSDNRHFGHFFSVETNEK
jgi:hypothetical protein